MKNTSLILLLCANLSIFSQSPWTQQKGKFYTQLSYTSISNYNKLFGNPENTERMSSDNTLQFYGEYGFSDNTTFIINAPLKMIKTTSLNSVSLVVPYTESGNKSSFGNIEIGVKHNFNKKNWLLTGQFSIEANTGSFDSNTGIRTGYDAWSFSPLFLAGRSFGESYFQSFIGGIIRTNGYSSNFKIGGEYGKKILKKIWLIGFVDIVKSFENGSIVLPKSNLVTGFYVNDQEYGSYGLKVIGEFTNNFGITGGIGAAFFGNRVAKKGAFTFGLYHKF